MPSDRVQSDATPPLLPAGCRYRVLAPLDGERPGMGELWRVEHTGTGHVYVLKALPPGADADARRRFRDEVRLLIQLGTGRPDPALASRRRHLVDIRDRFDIDLPESATDNTDNAGGKDDTDNAGEDDGAGGRPAYVMDWIEGPSLRRVIDDDALYLAAFGGDWRRAAEVFAQLLAGLSVLHALGIRHGDIKPQNALWGGPWDAAGQRLAPPQLRLIDFGVSALPKPSEDAPNDATLAALDASATRVGAAAGTWAYLAPELMRGGRAAGTPAADLYSAAILACELFTRERPAGSWSWPPEREAPLLGLPDALKRWIDRCRRPYPNERPRDADVAWSEFSRIVDRAKHDASTPAAPAVNGAPAPSRSDGGGAEAVAEASSSSSSATPSVSSPAGAEPAKPSPWDRAPSPSGARAGGGAFWRNLRPGWKLLALAAGLGLLALAVGLTGARTPSAAPAEFAGAMGANARALPDGEVLVLAEGRLRLPGGDDGGGAGEGKGGARGGAPARVRCDLFVGMKPFGPAWLELPPDARRDRGDGDGDAVDYRLVLRVPSAAGFGRVAAGSAGAVLPGWKVRHALFSGDREMESRETAVTGVALPSAASGRFAGDLSAVAETRFYWIDDYIHIDGALVNVGGAAGGIELSARVEPGVGVSTDAPPLVLSLEPGEMKPFRLSAVTDSVAEKYGPFTVTVRARAVDRAEGPDDERRVLRLAAP